MNANTAATSNGPTMKYHSTVVLAEKKKKVIVTMGELKMNDPKQNKSVFSWSFIILKNSLTKNNNSI